MRECGAERALRLRSADARRLLMLDGRFAKDVFGEPEIRLKMFGSDFYRYQSNQPNQLNKLD